MSDPKQRSRHSCGFSLNELLVTMLILAIITTVAVATYSGQSRESRRTQAKSALLDIATREEQFYAATNTYSARPSDVGYGGASFPISVGSGYYQIAVAVTVPVVSATGTVSLPAGFTLIATPLGAQIADQACAFFQLDNLGNQTATTSACW
jgi:type IV pilus assembly protein PilE